MEHISEAVNIFSRRLETAIAPGLSFRQFVTMAQSLEEQASLDAGQGDYGTNEKLYKLVATQRARLQAECESRYKARCRAAHKKLFGGADDLRQQVFQHFDQYLKDSTSLEKDWEEWSARFLVECGQQSGEEGGEEVDMGEESRLLLEVLRESASQMVAAVHSQAQQQAAQQRHAALRAREQLDQSNLAVLKLQGEKENDVAICRSMGSLVSELQQEQADQAELVRTLQSQLAIAGQEVRAGRLENETLSLKYEKLVARVVSKTKEASVLVADKTLLLAENETCRRELRFCADSGGKRRKRAKGEKSSSDEAVLRELNDSYSEQIRSLQSELDVALQKCREGVEEKEEERRKQLEGTEKKRTELLAAQLEESSKRLKEEALACSRLEGRLSAKEAECASQKQQLQSVQGTHQMSLSLLKTQHAEQEEVLSSQGALLLRQLGAAQRELQEARAESERVAEEKVSAEQLQLQLQLPAEAASTEDVSSSLQKELASVTRELESTRDALRSERESHRKKETNTLRAAQTRISDMDMAYFHVEAELKLKTGEAKRYWGQVKQLEEEASAQDRLRRKAELQAEEEAQRRLQAEGVVDGLRKNLDAATAAVGQKVAELGAAQKENAVMALAQEAAVEDLAALLERGDACREENARLREEVRDRNDLDYALSEATKAGERSQQEKALLQQEVAVLSPLRDRVQELEKQVQRLEEKEHKMQASLEAVGERETKCSGLEEQFEEVAAMNSLLLGENAELEGQLETISEAFQKRGELLRDLESRLDVSSSDAAYLRSDNTKVREEVRGLSERVRTLMANYNEASSQNEEKGFALLQLNGQQHELQSNLSQLGSELSQLRDLPAEVSRLESELSTVQGKLQEAESTLEQLSLLSAEEGRERDGVIEEITEKFEAVSRDYDLLVREHAALGGTYSQLAEDREALFAAYTALDCKLSEVEAEIME